MSAREGRDVLLALHRRRSITVHHEQRQGFLEANGSFFDRVVQTMNVSSYARLLRNKSDNCLKSSWIP